MATPARAAEDHTRPHVVEIHVDGNPSLVAQTRTVATEILLRISVVPVVLAEDTAAPSYPAPGEPFVRAYLDFRSPAPRLVIVDGKTRRELDRRVLPEGASPETSVEAVVHVLYMVVESLLDEPVSEPAAEPPHPVPSPEPQVTAPAERSPPSPPKKSEPPSESRLGLEAGALFRTLYLGGPHLQPGGGLVLDVRMRRGEPRVSIAASVAAHAPVELSLDAARVTLLPWTASLTPTWQGELGSNVLGLVGASASVTWFSLSSEAPPGTDRGTSAGGADLAIGLVAGARLNMSSRFAVTLSGTLDLDLAPRTFVAEVGGERRVLTALPRVRPLVSLSATYSLLGSNGSHAEVD